jgi:hypothetical protein
MSEAARRHITVEKIDIARQAGIKERRLIHRGLAAADQRAAAWGAIFLELLAQRGERSTRQGRDRAAEAVQNVALEKLPDFRCQALRPSRNGKGGDTCDRRLRFQRLWIGHLRSAPEWGHGHLLAENSPSITSLGREDRRSRFVGLAGCEICPGDRNPPPRRLARSTMACAKACGAFWRRCARRARRSAGHCLLSSERPQTSVVSTAMFPRVARE